MSDKERLRQVVSQKLAELKNALKDVPGDEWEGLYLCLSPRIEELEWVLENIDGKTEQPVAEDLVSAGLQLRESILQQIHEIRGRGERHDLPPKDLSVLIDYEQALIMVNEIVGKDPFEGLEDPKPTVENLVSAINTMRTYFGETPYPEDYLPTATEAIEEIERLCSPDRGRWPAYRASWPTASDEIAAFRRRASGQGMANIHRIGSLTAEQAEAWIAGPYSDVAGEPCTLVTTWEESAERWVSLVRGGTMNVHRGLIDSQRKSW